MTEVVTIKPSGKRRAAIAAAVVVALAAVGVGYKLLSGGKKSAAAATVNASTNATRPNGQRRNGVAGTLASVTGDTLLVTDQNGVKTTVHTNSSTIYTTSATGALSDVKVGDRLVAMGTNAGTNHIAATRVNDAGAMDANGAPGNGQAPPGGRRFGNGNGTPPNGNGNNPNAPAPGTFAFGTVSSINGNTILVKDANGTETTVDTTSSTAFTVVKRIALSDLQTGERVRVNGPKAADGSITATSVQEGAGGFGFGGPRGGTGTNGNGDGATGTGATGTGA